MRNVGSDLSLYASRESMVSDLACKATLLNKNIKHDKKLYKIQRQIVADHLLAHFSLSWRVLAQLYKVHTNQSKHQSLYL